MRPTEPPKKLARSARRWSAETTAGADNGAAEATPGAAVATTGTENTIRAAEGPLAAAGVEVDPAPRPDFATPEETGALPVEVAAVVIVTSRAEASRRGGDATTTDSRTVIIDGGGPRPDLDLPT